MSDTVRTKLGIIMLVGALALPLGACSRVITHEPSAADHYDSVSEQNATYGSVQAPPGPPRL